MTHHLPRASQPRRRAGARPLRTLAAAALAVGLAACGGGEQKAQGGGGQGGGAPPPPEVAVVAVQPQSAPLITELPGRVEASRVAQVRARAAVRRSRNRP